MTFLDASSLPADLRRVRVGPTQLKATTDWLDVAKIPPLPVDDAFIDGQLALELSHDQEEIRQALKRHSQPQALDRFVAALCRQLPDAEAVHMRYAIWRFIAIDFGGPETADVLAELLIRPGAAYLLRFGAIQALGVIGSRRHLPAIALVVMRIDQDARRRPFDAQFAAAASRLKLSQADLEDWSLPDAATPAENQQLRAPQVERLQKAMLSGRRWTVETFEGRILRQPIMAPLAATLVWGYFDQSDRLLQAFLIGPDGACPAPPPNASAGIVHPAHVSPEEAARWRQETAGLQQPFPQWKSTAISLAPEDAAATSIPRLPDNSLPAAAFLCRLEALGWQRPKTRTRLDHHTRAFPDLGITAVIRYTGIPLQFGGEWTPQAITDCFFTAGKDPLPLSRVSPIAVSSVLGDLQSLAGGKR